MELLSQFRLNPHRIYKVSKRMNKGIETFSPKQSASYLDYSVDYSRRLQDGEYIIKGNVTVNGRGVKITSVIGKGSYLTAFIDGGLSNQTYFLTYEAQTNLGGSYIQEMVLPITGQQKEAKERISFLAFTEHIKPPDTRPPLNAIRMNNRYLVNDSGFFMGV